MGEVPLSGGNSKNTKDLRDASCKGSPCWTEREFFIDNLLVRIHFIVVMMRWTVLAP